MEIASLSFEAPSGTIAGSWLTTCDRREQRFDAIEALLLARDSHLQAVETSLDTGPGGLPHGPAAVLRGCGPPRRTAAVQRETNDDPEEAARRRQSSVNRVLTILEAALNCAYRNGKAASDGAWHRVTPFRGVDAARVRYLSDAEAQRLVNACDAEFRPMVRAALLTGCRYGELSAARVDDFNPDAGTLTIRPSKSGRRHVVLTDEGWAFFKAAVAGKTGDALLLPRPDGAAWGKSHQQCPVSEACERAHISPLVTFHTLRHSYTRHAS